jgi:hypothetical protein
MQPVHQFLPNVAGDILILGSPPWAPAQRKLRGGSQAQPVWATSSLSHSTYNFRNR